MDHSKKNVISLFFIVVVSSFASINWLLLNISYNFSCALPCLILFLTTYVREVESLFFQFQFIYLFSLALLGFIGFCKMFLLISGVASHVQCYLRVKKALAFTQKDLHTKL